MRRRIELHSLLGVAVIGLAALSLAVVASTSVLAQSMPKSVTIGTQPPGSLQNMVANAIGKVVTEAGKFEMLVQPYTGPTTYLPIINSGELDFAVMTSIDLSNGYNQPRTPTVAGRENRYPFTPNVRLLMIGSPITAGILVRKDSPYRTVSDLKGLRLTGEYPAQLNAANILFTALASAKMTVDDIKVVPVTNLKAGMQAFLQGRADGNVEGLGTGRLKEMEAKVGVRFVSLDCSPQGAERLKKAVAGFLPLNLKAGSGTGIVDDTCLMVWDIYFLTHAKLPDNVARAGLESLYDNLAKLHPIHPFLKGWTEKRAVHHDVTIPYHPAAIQFYKDRGKWTAEMEANQKKLLAMN